MDKKPSRYKKGELYWFVLNLPGVIDHELFISECLQSCNNTNGRNIGVYINKKMSLHHSYPSHARKIYATELIKTMYQGEKYVTSN